MVQLVVFINLFFVPALPLRLMYRRSGKKPVVSLELLLQYCILASCNIPLTKAFVFLAKMLTGAFISVDSGYYTLASLLSSLLLPVLYSLYKNARVEIEIKREENE